MTWRSLDEFLRPIDPGDEFPGGLAPGVSRRRFLGLAAASLAAAALPGCTREPPESIVPWVRSPEDLVPGRPLFYATALTLGGYASGVLVETHEGRPTKVEGNPLHPSSLGATDAFAQAALFDLYDPDRSRAVVRDGRIETWDRLAAAIRPALEDSAGGLRILSGRSTSPTLLAQVEALLERHPGARWCQYEPFDRAAVREGNRLAFGRPLETLPRLRAARVVLALDADFLGCAAPSIRGAREFMANRRVREGGEPPGRLYVVESAPTSTGSIADHRFPLAARHVEAVLRRLAGRLGAMPGADGPGPGTPWLDAVARDLEARRGSALVLAGDGQPPEVHALAATINLHLDAVGRTVDYVRSPLAVPEAGLESIEDLAGEMAGGRVRFLVVLGGNPAFDAPPGLGFAEAMGRVGTIVRLGLHEDETSARATWHVPAAHPFETWSDARAEDGTITILQPLLEPLHGSRSAHDLLALLLADPRPAREIARATWSSLDERSWRRALHDGLVEGSASAPEEVELRLGLEPRPPRPAEEYEVVVRPDPSVWDGRFANNAWLQELPRPLSKLVWDDAAWIAPRLADRLGVETGDLLEIEVDGARVVGPAFVQPGAAEDSITVHAGYGRSRSGRFGTGVGFDVYPLWRDRRTRFATGALVRAAGGRAELVTTQVHHTMEGREPVRAFPISAWPGPPAHEGRESLLPRWPYPGPAWGMVIDLSLCVGCNACVLACQVENSVPVVGRREVARGREMHWLRIDRYYDGDPEAPAILHQPVLCMHCETAPCEPVCPVGATVHGSEGLNEMVYNRCVGTRYCSNNCPYKVRRFNFFGYAEAEPETLALGRNPDVTVRTRGVMEKCTYCVQRISAARIAAKKEERRIADGEVVTACQAACPTEAIVFGDLADPTSRVARRRAQPHEYELLGELGTRPRTTYLARVTDPNPDART